MRATNSRFLVFGNRAYYKTAEDRVSKDLMLCVGENESSSFNTICSGGRGPEEDGISIVGYVTSGWLTLT